MKASKRAQTGVCQTIASISGNCWKFNFFKIDSLNSKNLCSLVLASPFCSLNRTHFGHLLVVPRVHVKCAPLAWARDWFRAVLLVSLWEVCLTPSVNSMRSQWEGAPPSVVSWIRRGKGHIHSAHKQDTHTYTASSQDAILPIVLLFFANCAMSCCRVRLVMSAIIFGMFQYYISIVSYCLKIRGIERHPGCWR